SFETSGLRRTAHRDVTGWDRTFEPVRTDRPFQGARESKHMAISVQMPALGESVTEGTVTRWLKQEGDTVEQDEPLLEVSTDKVDTEIPSPAAGVLKKIIAQEDDTVEVGGELAVIGDGGEAPEEKSAAKEEMVEEETPTEEPDTHPEPATKETEEPQETESKPSAELSASATLVKMPEL